MRFATRWALCRARLKWWRISNGWGRDEGGINCALCKRFGVHCEFRDGEYCPVRLAVGRSGCTGTPWEDWSEHHNDMHEVPEGFPWIGFKKVKGCKECDRLAQAELIFLRNIRHL